MCFKKASLQQVCLAVHDQGCYQLVPLMFGLPSQQDTNPCLCSCTAHSRSKQKVQPPSCRPGGSALKASRLFPYLLHHWLHHLLAGSYFPEVYNVRGLCQCYFSPLDSDFFSFLIDNLWFQTSECESRTHPEEDFLRPLFLLCSLLLLQLPSRLWEPSYHPQVLLQYPQALLKHPYPLLQPAGTPRELLQIIIAFFSLTETRLGGGYPCGGRPFSSVKISGNYLKPSQTIYSIV